MSDSFHRVLVLFGIFLLSTSGMAADLEADPNDRAQAEAIAQKHLSQLGKDYEAHLEIPRHLIIISTLDRKDIKDTVKFLADFTDDVRRTLRIQKPGAYIIVVLPRVEDYKPPNDNERILGYYQPATQTLTSVDRGQILRHEFTHALHHVDMMTENQSHSIWVMEGLASLFESARRATRGLTTYTDLRLPGLQEAIREKRAIPLAELFAMDVDAFQQTPDLTYAEARYLMFYLQSKDKLATWYRAYKANYATDPTGQISLERVLGKKLPQLEEEWKKWVLSLPPPNMPRTRLGLEMLDTAQGVKIVGLSEDGTAVEAGIKEGDIIEKLNGRPVGNSAELLGALRRAEKARTAVLQIRRQGKTLQIRVALQ
jgi:hypothetical protein